MDSSLDMSSEGAPFEVLDRSTARPLGLTAQMTDSAPVPRLRPPPHALAQRHKTRAPSLVCLDAAPPIGHEWCHRPQIQACRAPAAQPHQNAHGGAPEGLVVRQRLGVSVESTK
ncbi:unnamed protein product [Pleuronectes platessa]|uniref:Uncharacterized protein n=1 Tax=Pleuronectes platessa TaxID=8262 RepID=A0A9N7TR47_PLEPL|nr:unnamed protein product [Pleuronectes platessa]